MFVVHVYVQYMQRMQYNVFGIFWHTCIMLIRASKYGNIFINLKLK